MKAKILNIFDANWQYQKYLKYLRKVEKSSI